MILQEANVIKELEKQAEHPVFYFFSTEEFLVRSYASKVLGFLLHSGDVELTRIEGPAPSIEEVVASAGTISMFGTKRIVEVALLEPSAMSDADVSALCDIMQSLENAVLVLTTVFKDDKAKTTKKAKQLIAAAEKIGLVAELTKPQPQDVKRFAVQCAQRQGAELSPSAATVLVERCGKDYYTLENEIAKLAAAVNYGEITRQVITEFGTQNIEADVFEMVRFVTAKHTARALEKLQQLLEMQNEPIAITAALLGAFVDMLRVKCGAEKKRNYATVYKDFGYRGSDYRLKKSAEAAAPYTKQQLMKILKTLCTLDAKLKSSAASGTVLLQAALCEIAQIGSKR